MQIKNVEEYYYDSVYYSGIAETIVGDGNNHDSDYYNQLGTGGLKINLLNYPETFRGYFWPTVNSGFNHWIAELDGRVS